MSKLQLRKELNSLTKDQIIQLVLEAYSARKEVKSYFDFFMDPDLEKLADKFRANIDKEMSRGKYSKSTARISKVRTFIRDFASYGVPVESVIEMMVYTLKLGLKIERAKYVSKTFMTGIARLAADILKTADKYAVFDSSMNLLQEALSGQYGYIGFVNYIRRELDWSLIKP